MLNDATIGVMQMAVTNNGVNKGTRERVLGPVKPSGLIFKHRFSSPNENPLDSIEWEKRDAAILNESGEEVFHQSDVEVPKSWSQLATNIVSSKYFHGTQGSSSREFSVKQIVTRVASTITKWGSDQRYFATEGDAKIFERELIAILINQYAAFNSPVWFNVGVEERPQCSACFINSVEDTMGSILDLVKTEGLLFKYGSGTGTNFSPLRSSRDILSSGGIASGPVSFMRGFDAFAGVIKSGGKTRRAAKMVILNVDHPDIEEFIESKAEEEKKAWALIDAGYSGGFNVPGGAYDSVCFQNANHSVRVTDDFMKAVEENSDWHTKSITSGGVCGVHRAKDLMDKISNAAHICGDPGLQFDTTVNEWHTCPNSGRIEASNPCAEFMFVNDSACNLASLNLMKFMNPDGSFDTEAFTHTVDVLITAQEIIVDNASYPTKDIGKNSVDFRPLGLGYANLGSLLMAHGLPYDSDQGREYGAVISALMTGQAYLSSSKVAEIKEPFDRYEENKEAFLNVIDKHYQKLCDVPETPLNKDVRDTALVVWEQARIQGDVHGFRNAQVTVLAPTGTIAFMMDCDTTGIEPDIALVKYKKLVGGGLVKIVNSTVPKALENLDYSDVEIKEIIEFIDINDTIEGAPNLKAEHLPVFDCAFKPAKGTRTIHYLGHIKMMGAVQPFISGAISKTVNLPSDVAPEDIGEVYMKAWKLGLKAIAIYRDGSKRTQPLSTSKTTDEPVGEIKPMRRRLPDERSAITHKFSIGGHEGYLTVGMFENGMPGEVFIVMAKEGSVVSGLMDSFATAVSLALQYGVPLKVLVNKFSHSRFEPSGYTNNPKIRIAKSVTDYIFRWLALKFLSGQEQADIGFVNQDGEKTQTAIEMFEKENTLRHEQEAWSVDR